MDQAIWTPGKEQGSLLKIDNGVNNANINK